MIYMVAVVETQSIGKLLAVIRLFTDKLQYIHLAFIRLRISLSYLHNIFFIQSFTNEDSKRLSISIPILIISSFTLSARSVAMVMLKGEKSSVKEASLLHLASRIS